MSTQKSNLNSQILEEAAEWFVEFETDDIGRVARQQFDEWLRRSPEHVRAFLELLPVWEQGGLRRPSDGHDLEALIARALNARDNIVSLNGRTQASTRAEGNGRAQRLIWVAAAMCVLSISLGTWFYSERNNYSTGIGEQRSIVLTDGSVVELNARSEVRVRYGEQRRDIELLEGQALFRVAHDTARPFIVHSGDARIRAVGTQFDVYRKQAATTVTVIEGRVSVAPENSQDNPERVATLSTPPAPGSASAEEIIQAGLLVAAGEQTTVSRDAVAPVTSANIDAALAWTKRRLVFQRTMLAEVVSEFNRYNARPMHIQDPQIAAFLVSGTFSSADPTALIRFLREQPGMRVIETTDDVRIVASQ